MQQNKLQRFAITLTLLIALALLLSSCETSPEVIEVPVAPPPVEWPDFPDPGDRVIVADDGTVSMDADYWVSIAEYAIRVESARMVYERFRELYAEE